MLTWLCVQQHCDAAWCKQVTISLSATEELSASELRSLLLLWARHQAAATLPFAYHCNGIDGTEGSLKCRRRRG